MKTYAAMLMILLVAALGTVPGSAAIPSAGFPTSRTFYMGVTPTPHDKTPDGDRQVYAFIRDHTDINVHHFDEGIPWPEALAHSSYHPNVEKNLRERAAQLMKGRPTYVAVTPVRDHGIAKYWSKDGSMTLPDAWKTKRVDDPDVAQAYLSFCRDLIQRFHPDYLAYGIEVNMSDPALWHGFVALARQVYAALKAENPGLRLFVTLQVDFFWQDPKGQAADIAQILPYTDFIAVSAYPYFFDHPNSASLPSDYFSRLREGSPEKPFAVAETGFTARDVEAFGKKIPGRPEWQDHYLRWLLHEAHRLHAEFVVWFLYRDYDALWNRIRFLGSSVEAFKVFKSDGLLDGDGHERPSTITWHRWLRLPRN